MDDLGFSYQLHKNGKVFLLYHGRVVRTLDGTKAAQFVAQLEEAGETEAQLLMAKLTGNFKRGNERQSAKRGGR